MMADGCWLPLDTVSNTQLSLLLVIKQTTLKNL